MAGSPSVIVQMTAKPFSLLRAPVRERRILDLGQLSVMEVDQVQGKRKVAFPGYPASADPAVFLYIRPGQLHSLEACWGWGWERGQKKCGPRVQSAGPAGVHLLPSLPNWEGMEICHWLGRPSPWGGGRSSLPPPHLNPSCIQSLVH